MARPREFDEETVLQTVMDTFREAGYEGTSVRRLAEATGVRMASLYAAYGDKRGLYRAALERYDHTAITPAVALLSGGGDARGRVGALLQTVIDAVARAKDRRSCLLCNAAVDQALHDADTRDWVRGGFKRMEQAFARALAHEPPYDDDPAARRGKAQELTALYFGLRVLARGGASVATLKTVAAQAVAGI